MSISTGTQQGILYQTGTSGTDVTIEFHLTDSHSATQTYHFTVYYSSLAPGIFTVRYYEITSNGNPATVGAQKYLGANYTGGDPCDRNGGAGCTVSATTTAVEPAATGCTFLFPSPTSFLSWTFFSSSVKLPTNSPSPTRSRYNSPPSILLQRPHHLPWPPTHHRHRSPHPDPQHLRPDLR